MLRKNELVSEVKKVLHNSHWVLQRDMDHQLDYETILAEKIVERILSLIQGDNQRRS